MKKTKIDKGITLIALIITIVILLILAVVTIGAVQESTIITHAENAKERYQIEKIEEKIKLEKAEMKLAEYGKEITVIDIIKKYEGEEATVEPVSIASNAKSVPENMPAGNYYILTPEKYALENNENIRRYAKLTSRGEEREENLLKNVYVINEQLDIYYIIEASLSLAEDEIVIAAEEDLSTVGYFYNTTYNPKQPEIVPVDGCDDDENEDMISDINSSLSAYTGNSDFDVPITFFSQTPPTQGDIQAIITNYDGTEENITLTTTNNKKWTYQSMILTGKEDYVEWKEYIALDFYPYAKYSSSPSRYEPNDTTHYFSFDAGGTLPFHKIKILGATIEFPFNCQAYVGWGDLDFYDNMNPVYNDISKVSKVVVNFADNTSKKYTNENIFDANQYYSEDSCFYYSSQDIPILYTNGAFIINMPEASLNNPITSIIVEEEGKATKYNVTESTEIINSNAWN